MSDFSPCSLSTSALVPAPGGDNSFYDLDGSSLAKFQTMCSSVQETKVNPSLTVISHSIGNNDILCDISTGSLRPLVPLQLRRKLFEQLHNISHPGVRASKTLITSRFVWPGMSRDVGSWAKSCISCQKSKISTHVHSTVSPIPVPTWRFSHVHVDLVGPLPSSYGFMYLFTMIDRTTRWLEAVPLSSISAESYALAVISTWISRFGVPAVLTSDRGSQFTSSGLEFVLC